MKVNSPKRLYFQLLVLAVLLAVLVFLILFQVNLFSNSNISQAQSDSLVLKTDNGVVTYIVSGASKEEAEKLIKDAYRTWWLTGILFGVKMLYSPIIIHVNVVKSKQTVRGV